MDLFHEFPKYVVVQFHSQPLDIMQMIRYN